MTLNPTISDAERIIQIVTSRGGTADLRDVFNGMRDRQGGATKEEHICSILDTATLDTDLKVKFRDQDKGTPIQPYSRQPIQYARANPYGAHYETITFYEDVVFTAP